MNHPTPLTLAEQLAAAQTWWRDAGVYFIFHDDPRPWLADDAPSAEQALAPAASAPVSAPPPEPRIGGDSALWPQDLAAFQSWWLQEPSLDFGGMHPRVAPRGRAAASLMVLVPMPEEGDETRLLSGPEGRLVASLTRSMELDPSEVYVAAALPRRTLLPDWERLRSGGLGEVLLHHIALASPKRVIVLGTRVLPLLGHDPAQAAPGVSQLPIQERQIPMLASYAPERLLESARQRQALWQRWLDWTEGAPA